MVGADRQGEAEAIALAQSPQDSSALFDDALPRRLARRFNVPRVGTPGIVGNAGRDSLIEQIIPVIEQMEQAGVYADARLVDAILRDVGERP